MQNKNKKKGREMAYFAIFGMFLSLGDAVRHFFLFSNGTQPLERPEKKRKGKKTSEQKK
jgi:hypothetical protein